MRVLALFLLLSVILAGCGDEGDSGAGGEGAPAATAGAGADDSEGKGGSAATREGEDDSGAARGGEATESEGKGDAAARRSPARRKRQFVAAAEKLCERRVKAMERKVAALFKEGAGGSLARLVTRVIAPGLEAEARELRELRAPAGDEQRVAEIVAAIEAMTAGAREEPQTFLSRPDEFEEAHELAQSYGIGACGTLSR